MGKLCNTQLLLLPQGTSLGVAPLTSGYPCIIKGKQWVERVEANDKVTRPTWMAIRYKLIIYYNIVVVTNAFAVDRLLNHWIAGAYFLCRNSCPCLKEGSAGRLTISEVAKKNKVHVAKALLPLIL